MVSRRRQHGVNSSNYSFDRFSAKTYTRPLYLERSVGRVGGKLPACDEDAEGMMPVTVRCPSCGQKASVADELRDRAVRCARCGQPFRLVPPNPGRSVASASTLLPEAQATARPLAIRRGQPAQPLPAANPMQAGRVRKSKQAGVAEPEDACGSNPRTARCEGSTPSPGTGPSRGWLALRPPGGSPATHFRPSSPQPIPGSAVGSLQPSRTIHLVG